MSDPTDSCGGVPPDDTTQLGELGEADAEPELLLVDQVDSEPAAEVQSTSQTASALPLSKFRPAVKVAEPVSAEPVSPAASANASPPAGGSPLGRVALVRRSVDAEGTEKPSLLLRLLGAF